MVKKRITIIIALILIPMSLLAVDKPSLQVLLQRLQSSDAVARSRAAEELGALYDQRAIPHLVEAMDDPNVNVQFSAIKALGELKAYSAVEAIAAKLKHPDALVRIASSAALCRIPDRKASYALTFALHDDNSYVRANAATAFGNLGDRSLKPLLAPACSDPDPGVRVAAVQALSRLGDPAAAAYIRPLLNDNEDTVRRSARVALKDLRTVWSHMGLMLLALIPALVLLHRYHQLDRLEPEPYLKIYEAFFLGIACAGVAGWINFLNQKLFPAFSSAAQGYGSPFALTSILAAASVGMIEEGCKFFAMLLFIWKWPDFNERFDGILYSVAVGLGFAAYENLFYVSDWGMQVGVVRALLSVPAHATSGILMGYFFGLAKGDQLRWGSYSRKLFVYGYLSAALFHAVWDAIAFQRDLVSLFFLGVASVLAVLIRKIFLQKIFE